ncbi:hypothetical protein BLD50_01455 [Bacillus cereus]|nr:hypothetical protein BLD50_01455 [Bacillus cereus]
MLGPIPLVIGINVMKNRLHRRIAFFSNLVIQNEICRSFIFLMQTMNGNIAKKVYIGTKWCWLIDLNGNKHEVF